MSFPTQPNPKKTKDLPNEVRMVLAFVLMGLILVATPFVYKKLGIATPEPPKTEAAKNEAAKTEAPKTEAGALPALDSQKPAVETAASGVASAISAAKPDQIVLETRLYRITFSNEGAVVKSWMLKNFKDMAGKPLELVNDPGAKKLGIYPFSLEFRGTKPSRDLNKVLWVGHASADGLSVDYDYSDGRTVAKKSFTLQKDGDMVTLTNDTTLDGRGIPSLLQWRGGFGDMAVQNAASQQATIHYDTQSKKLVRTAPKEAKDGPLVADGVFSFAGIDDQYFTVAFLRTAGGPVQTTAFDDVVPTTFNKSEEPYPGVAVGGESRNQLSLYVGPKELSSLHKVNPKLEDIVDWGYFGLIAKPLFIVLHWMNNDYIHNYGWSIILLTIGINLALFPLKLANLKSMKKMQVLQPQIARINDKYKGIGMSDPRSQQKQAEIMAIHKEHGVNPLGGCIPLLVQLPFLWAFYKVLTVSIELRFASWMWVADLSAPEHFQIKFLPLILVATGFLLQKMTPTPAGGDPAQAKMMQFMPLMWGFFFWSASSGLVLYWLTGNLVGIAQQWFFNKTTLPPTVEVIAGPKRVAAKDGKKKS